MIICNFNSIKPDYYQSQNDIMEWFAEAHAESQTGTSLSEMKELIRRYGCRPEKIGFRFTSLKDLTHRKWNEMEIYDFRKGPSGAGLQDRIRKYDEVVSPLFERLFPTGMQAPDDLIHVTCTGYLSPSEAQKIVDKRGWHQQTTVTHAYHMGCYAAFPAVRLGVGFLSSPERLNNKGTKKNRVDLVHTEFCSLHANPAVHTPEQIIVQSLFADGFVRYSLSPEGTSGLKILTLLEEIAPDSSQEMSWVLSDWGMKMSLSRDVPMHLIKHVPLFLNRLLALVDVPLEKIQKEAVFAIHPGGPKIIDGIQEWFSLSEHQIATSRKVLFERGNMSSATLPHIWKEISEDPQIPPKTYVVSMAFGPGLTLCGGIFQKV